MCTHSILNHGVNVSGALSSSSSSSSTPTNRHATISLTFASTGPLQYALADYLTEHPEHHRSLPAFYAERRDYFAGLLARTAFAIGPSRGTYFQLGDYSAISDMPDVEFARWLTVEHGVAVIPISVFYQEPPDLRLVRFCFAKQTATLDEAARRLREL